MKRSTILAVGAVGAAGLVGIGLLVLGRAPEASRAIASTPRATRVELPKSAAPLAAFATKEERSPKPERRAAASRARMTLAYASAKRGDWATARTGFERAAVAAKDVPGMDPGFGTIADQAAYQALVCLSHERPKAEAIAGFRSFLRERPESPLVHAAHRRLGILRGGTADAADDALLQSAISRQEARIRFETSVCGPKSIAEMLRRTGRKEPGYKEIARLCGTTATGTTMAGMRQGLKALGVDSTGAELNRLDFTRAPLPLLMLEHDHYVLVTARSERAMTVWDSRFSHEAERALPPLDDRTFRALVLTTALPPAEYDAGTPPKPAPLPTKQVRPKATIVDVPSTPLASNSRPTTQPDANAR